MKTPALYSLPPDEVKYNHTSLAWNLLPVPTGAAGFSPREPTKASTVMGDRNTARAKSPRLGRHSQGLYVVCIAAMMLSRAAYRAGRMPANRQVPIVMTTATATVPTGMMNSG